MFVQVDALSWGEHGIPGLVIGALFIALFYMLKSHREERKEILDRHKEERGDWKADADKRTTEVQHVVKSLENVIAEQGKR